MDTETKELAKSAYNGTLATKLKQNMEFSMRGIAVGAICGFILSTITGGGKMKLMMLGGLAGGGAGYILSKIIKKS